MTQLERPAAALTAGLVTLSLSAAGLLSWPGAVATLGLLLAGAAFLRHAPPRHATWIAFLGAGALLAGLALSHSWQMIVFTVPGTALAAVLATHRRALVTSGLASGAGAVLALATRPTPLVGIAVAASWVMLLVSLRLAHLDGHYGHAAQARPGRHHRSAADLAGGRPARDAGAPGVVGLFRRRRINAGESPSW